jgi:hypothetical protein
MPASAELGNIHSKHQINLLQGFWTVFFSASTHKTEIHNQHHGKSIAMPSVHAKGAGHENC